MVPVKNSRKHVILRRSRLNAKKILKMAFIQSTLKSIQTQNVPWRDNWDWGVKVDTCNMFELPLVSRPFVRWRCFEKFALMITPTPFIDKTLFHNQDNLVDYLLIVFSRWSKQFLKQGLRHCESQKTCSFSNIYCMNPHH